METDGLLTGRKWDSGMKTRTQHGLLGLSAFLSLLSLALIIALAVLSSKGCGSRSSGNPFQAASIPNDHAATADLRSRIFSSITIDNIASNLANITRKVHVAGTPENMDVLGFIKNHYQSVGLDKVEYAEYAVNLNYPNYQQPNTITGPGGVLSSGKATLTGSGEARSELGADAKAPVLWLAFSPANTTTAQIVYANYGHEEDFDAVAKLNVNVQGKICMMRYGGGFRGDKVSVAGTRGCSGVILYSDYMEAGPPGGDNSSDVWPQSVWLPPTGGQRGSTMIGDGDWATPLRPSKNYTFRSTSMQSAKRDFIIPNIPATPIGYADATKIFAALDGSTTLPSNFQGGIPGVTYRLTGSAQFTLTTHNQDTVRTPIKNVIGRMYGSEEPDRWVLLINHVDAWTYGSQDPNGGTTLLLELARAFMAAHNATGWRPRRSLMFLSVDCEEYGLIGSTEWVEEMSAVLGVRAVAIVNVDVAIHGTTSFDASAVPLLYRTVVAAAKLVPNPNSAEVALGRTTVYDTWRHYKDPNKGGLFLKNQTEVPYISVPSSGSDHSGFLNYVGVPAAYISFRCYPRPCYPLYHTMYEIYWTKANVVDPGFKFSKATADVWAEIARDLSDSLIIPFNVSDYSAIIQVYVKNINQQLQNQGFGSKFDLATATSSLADAANRFSATAIHFQGYVDGANRGSLAVSVGQQGMLNERLTALERAFIIPRGLPNRHNFRHVVFATSIHDNYQGVSFAGIVDTAEAYLATRDPVLQASLLHTLQESITDVQFGIESAILILDMSGYPL